MPAPAMQNLTGARQGTDVPQFSATVIPSGVGEENHSNSRCKLDRLEAGVGHTPLKEACGLPCSGRCALWLICILGCACTAFLFAAPLCADVPQCAAENFPAPADWDAVSSPKSRVVGLGVLLAKEMSSLILAYQEAQDKRIARIMQMGSFNAGWHSLALMCTILALLTATELTFASGYNWSHAVPPIQYFARDWGLVHTLRYIEWMINCPLLIVLCGHFVLGRPLSEVVAPAFITYAYIYLAWVGLVVASASLRIFFATASFAGYGWASVLMVRWVLRFRTTSPKVAGGRIRALLLMLLVVSFGMYGLIYLLALFGAITTHVEHEVYARSDCAVKLAVTTILSALRSAERKQAFSDLIVEHTGLNTALMSLLRSSFDHTLSCSYDEAGRCRLSTISTPDTKALEALVRRSVAGAFFDDLLSTQEDRDRFSAHLQSTTQTSFAANEKSIKFGAVASWDPQSWDPQASFSMTPSMAELRLYDLACAVSVPQEAAWTAAQQSVRVCIHLSVAPRDSSHRGGPRQMVLALSIVRPNERVPTIELVTPELAQGLKNKHADESEDLSIPEPISPTLWKSRRQEDSDAFAGA
eukprot:gnl/TRDRNA2_/TRDRNA2_203719_c0_seq1.p1 gnl/TRDRNA2_/TRDRNA2_203719_c0~~gnl/TRDRNA2_/TRDRNA2_203719_c0_seq1.p1  ORF type:complete len:586 (+),score=54.16 gnl/TRDRNA2_/TRDRNA2_203719_c0_seq1:35-1792(+)